MVKRSWFKQNGLFYTILALVVLLHLLLLVKRMVDDSETAWNAPTESSVAEPPIKVKMLTKGETVALRKQIAQSSDSATKTKPINSRFLSDKDRSFERQTLARKVDKFNEGGKGKGDKNISLGDIGAFEKSHDPFEESAKAYTLAKAHKAAQQTAGQATGEGRGVSSTNDFIQDVPLGDLTYLNTTEYKYYGFYHRIRQKLEQFWGSSIQDKAASLMRQGRNIASGDNLITSVQVTLNAEGEITDVAVRGTSGVKELDDAAVESFNRAGPFPHPPKGMIQNGLVKIEWGFVVQTSSSSL